MAVILVDGIANISIHSGVLRVECVSVGADAQQRPSGTLVIPGASAAQIVQALVNGIQELDKKLREQQNMPTAGRA